jgi:hypothetical protein
MTQMAAPHGDPVQDETPSEAATLTITLVPLPRVSMLSRLISYCRDRLSSER